MSLPNATITPQDFGLVSVPSSAAKIVAKIGPCSLGTAVANVPLAFGGPGLQPLKDALGTGPLTEAACESLSNAGGPLVVVPTTNSLAGTASAVTHSPSTGTSTMTVQLPGGGTCAPCDAYSVIVQITRAGLGIAVGGGAFTYSLDGGVSYSQSSPSPRAGSTRSRIPVCSWRSPRARSQLATSTPSPALLPLRASPTLAPPSRRCSRPRNRSRAFTSSERRRRCCRQSPRRRAARPLPRPAL